MFVISGTGSTVLAALSYGLIEHPIRASAVLDRFRLQVIAVSLAISVAAGLVFVPAILEAPSATANIAKVSLRVARIPDSGTTLLNWHTAQNDIPTVPDCIRKPADACIVVHGTGPRVLLMGDSIARMWTPAFMAIAKRESLTLAIASYPACPWQLLKRHGLDQSPRCPAHARYWYQRMIPGYDPDVIVLAERAFDAPGNVMSFPVNGRSLLVTTAPAERALATTSRNDVQLMHRAGRKIVILQPTPLAPAADFNQLSCLSTRRKDCGSLQSRLDRPRAPVRAAREQPRRVHPSSRSSRVPAPAVCDPVVNNIIVRRDHTHITATYAAALARPIDDRLRARGILPPRSNDTPATSGTAS